MELDWTGIDTNDSLFSASMQSLDKAVCDIKLRKDGGWGKRGTGGLRASLFYSTYNKLPLSSNMQLNATCFANILRVVFN